MLVDAYRAVEQTGKQRGVGGSGVVEQNRGKKTGSGVVGWWGEQQGVQHRQFGLKGRATLDLRTQQAVG